uniref:Uncharacterized protein n=1 Tax=Coccidioides posadasii RMSCC 3488 TaxID=454284 RepID=A0A0J6FLB2_COCPO|nr:hypothetical protein CPAG_07410 [Coccidioides posadasii RMSCC 3488]
MGSPGHWEATIETAHLVFHLLSSKPPLGDGAIQNVGVEQSNLFSRMSASSGVNGWCDVCRHPNNEHNYYTCTATGCRKKFKICQTGSHVEFNITGHEYVLCKWCPNHPYSSPYNVTDMPRLYK